MSNTFRTVRAITRTMRKGRWQFFQSHCNSDRMNLRCADEPGHCPLSFVAAKEIGVICDCSSWDLAAERLGISRGFAEEIIKSADTLRDHNRKLRRILLRAAGLAPERKT